MLHVSNEARDWLCNPTTWVPLTCVFSRCRHGFGSVVKFTEQITQLLRDKGPQAVVDVDNVAQRESLDVIGVVGFGKNFETTRCPLPLTCCGLWVLVQRGKCA